LGGRIIDNAMLHGQEARGALYVAHGKTKE